MEHFYQTIDGWSTEQDQGELLKTILPLTNINEKLKIAEIGVYKGRCTAMWNTILLNESIDYEYKAIDHFLGSAEHDKSINYYEVTIKNLNPILNKIELIKNDSISESKNYEDGYFDIVYIDASHEYEFVLSDINSWLPKVKKGGIICGDDFTPGWAGVVKAVTEVFEGRINKVGNQQWWVKI